MTRTLLVVLLFAGACAGSEYTGPRYDSREDGISFAKLRGWKISRDRATLVLTSPGRAATIAVRSIPRTGLSEPRDADNVFPAVETVLRALPRARVSRPMEVDDTDFHAVAYDVEFTPPGRRHQRYQRRHVTLLAETHVIHVFIVAPIGQLDYSRHAFDTIVKTIREEG